MFSWCDKNDYIIFSESPTMRVFGVLPMVPLVGNICTNGITIFYHLHPMVPLEIKVVQMVQILPTNGTIEEPRTHAIFHTLLLLLLFYFGF